MDYLQIYNNQFDATWADIKSKTKADLKAAKKNKRNFNTLFNNITSTLYDEQKKIIENFKENNLKSCFELFEKRHSYYNSNLERKEVIALILQNEVKEEYLRLGKSDYVEFVEQLANQQSIYNIQRHLNNYLRYYELIYVQDRYEYFYAKDFENSDYETSKEYIEMLDIQHPERTSEPSLFNLIEAEHNKISKEKFKKNNSIISTRERICNEYDTKERAVLLYLLKNRLKNEQIDSTELIKLILIIGSTEKFEIFDVGNASNSYLYNQARKGYSVFKLAERKERLSSLKIKLKNNGLKYIAGELAADYGQL
tara:strand:- start:4471 stop:5403 length:933 start_codon:yes stop_codon:yes gene_type:complete